MPLLECIGLVKDYPGKRAVDGVDYHVERGEIGGLLGPNGAGKTTTLEILEGLGTPTSGRVQVLGLDPGTQAAQVKQLIGVQLQASSYFEHLTLREILVLFGSFYRTRRDPDELLELVGLADKRKALVGQLSGGQAQRFSIVAALVNDPEVVFLDEPTTGLDPQARRNLWDFISWINREEGKTVVLTTHYMEEAEILCDRVAIIDQGEIREVLALTAGADPSVAPPGRTGRRSAESWTGWSADGSAHASGWVSRFPNRGLRAMSTVWSAMAALPVYASTASLVLTWTPAGELQWSAYVRVSTGEKRSTQGALRQLCRYLRRWRVGLTRLDGEQFLGVAIGLIGGRELRLQRCGRRLPIAVRGEDHHRECHEYNAQHQNEHREDFSD
jgi:ABC-2 type transport system ATP-binding protein